MPRSPQIIQTEVVKSTASKPPAVIGLVFSAVGLYPLLIALGVVPTRPGSVHCPMAVLAAVGGAFVLAGLSIFVNGLGFGRKSIVYKILGLLTGLCFLTPFVWLIFFNSTTPMFIRVVFGLFFCVMGLIMLAAAVLPKSFNIGEHIHIETKDL